MTVEFRVFDDDLTTLLGVFDQPYGWEFSRDAAGEEAGQLLTPHDSPAVQAVPSMLGRDRVINVRDNGQNLMSWIARRRARRRGDVWDEVGITGPGVLELMRQAVVYPVGGLPGLLADERHWGWFAPGFDWEAAGFTTPNSRGPQGDPDPQLEVGGDACVDGYIGNPPGWPAPQAEIIWADTLFVSSSGGTLNTPCGDGVGYSDPEGCVLFVGVWEGAPVGMEVQVWLAMINEGTFWIDGVEVASNEGAAGSQTWKDPIRVNMTVSSSTVTFAARVCKRAIPNIDGYDAAGGLLMAALGLTGGGEFGTFLFGTDTSNWLHLPYPDDEPTITIGTILVDLFDEWREDRGGPLAITRDFDRVDDSSGAPWDELPGFVAQVGNDTWLSVAERLADLGVSVDMTPGYVVRAWGDGTRGQDRTGSVTIGLDQVSELDVETEDELFNVILVRSANAWLERPSPAPSSNRREAFLSLGLINAAETAREIGDAVASFFEDSERRVVRFTTNSATPGVPTPGVDYDVFDLITAPWRGSNLAGPWTTTGVFVLSWTARVDETGEIDYVHEVLAP